MKSFVDVVVIKASFVDVVVMKALWVVEFVGFG